MHKPTQTTQGAAPMCGRSLSENSNFLSSHQPEERHQERWAYSFQETWPVEKGTSQGSSGIGGETHVLFLVKERLGPECQVKEGPGSRLPG